MNINLDVEIRPFDVPAYVYSSKQVGVNAPNQYPLREMSAETLHALCDEFRSSVFIAAGFSCNSEDWK